MKLASFLFPLMALVSPAVAASLYPGDASGSARMERTSATTATLGNHLFTASYKQEDNTIVFGGFRTADGTELLRGGTPLFSIRLQDGRTLTPADMKRGKLRASRLKASSRATRGAEREEGCEITCTFHAPDQSFSVDWAVELRNGSHYLRQHLTITARKPVLIPEITALEYLATPSAGDLSLSGNTTHGRVVESDRLFFGLETPMSLMQAGGEGANTGSSWTPTSWEAGTFGPAFNMPASFRKAYGERYAATNGPILSHLRVAEGPVKFRSPGECRISFRYMKGNHKLNVVGVQLLNKEGKVVSEDIHAGSTGHQSHNNTYTITVPDTAEYQLRYWVETLSESIASSGEIVLSRRLDASSEEKQAADGLVRGIWQRQALLEPGQSWSVTGVVGLFAPEQKRRSFLAYVERERAMPYRPFVHYNDWYEIGIRVHDHQDPRKRTNEAMWLELLDIWNRELYVKRGTRLDGFIVDDGWDEFNSLWDFHCGFPNGFSKMARKAARQGAGLGTWLGPVGGYGASKRMRLDHWNRNHPNNKIENFQLSNEEYFKAFVARCRQMIRDYGMRYFKFDGISTKFHAKGPAHIEDAEGIINVIAALRKAKPDVFVNATVGTWASPFWYFHADSIWRQENDFDRVGNAGDPRDRWITYRDRLVHEVFVEGAPLFPINSVMTHGTMITKNGPPSVMSRDPENCRKELRMAFGSGSALQEIYADNDLLSQQGGVLWDELARCIAWVRRNQDVLPDVHWVGGNPWNGHDGDIYGYAAWNREKATLTLRNSSARAKTLTSTLRELFDIPPGVKGTVRLSNSFDDQRLLPGITDQELDVDATIRVSLEPLEVLVMEGRCTMRRQTR